VGSHSAFNVPNVFNEIDEIDQINEIDQAVPLPITYDPSPMVLSLELSASVLGTRTSILCHVPLWRGRRGRSWRCSKETDT
jgi:hypothetical protein